MDLFKLISGMKNKYVEAKVYSVVFREDDTKNMSLFVCMAYTLEDVIVAFRRQTGDAEGMWVPFMWNFISLRDLITESFGVTKVTRAKKSSKDIKNELMQKIINNKDKVLFETNKKLFDENEIKFIQDKLDLK